MGTITTTIQRKWLAEIVAKRKKIEYRELKPYWERRLATVKPPFRLRLINGMRPRAPEVTVVVTRVVKSVRNGEYQFHLGRVVEVKNWDAKNERPRYR